MWETSTGFASRCIDTLQQNKLFKLVVDNNKNIPDKGMFLLAARPGFEPGITDPESVVLPIALPGNI